MGMALALDEHKDGTIEFANGIMYIYRATPTLIKIFLKHSHLPEDAFSLIKNDHNVW
jgi:hypothetical protein